MKPVSLRRELDDIVETLVNAKERNRGCTLLLGAGCSVEAGIPTAAGFVEIIKKRYPRAYERAKNKTYPATMAELSLSERRDLIAEYVDKAKINWAHVCIACLIRSGYVDRVLTTNFDRLVLRACALLGEFPAVYDFAVSQLMKAADIPDRAVFYLHGQRTGFILINTDEDFRKHSELLGPVFEDAGRGRVWIVVGYSGESDPVFDHLAKVDQFDNGLYWVGYQDNEPATHVRDGLLVRGKYAFYTSGFDADSFFVQLCQKLRPGEAAADRKPIFPPDLVARPFTHLDRIMDVLTPNIPGQLSEEDVIRTPRQWIKTAIELFEQVEPGVVPDVEGPHVEERGLPVYVEAQQLLIAGDYEGVVAFRKQYEEDPSSELADPLSWGYVLQGNALLDQEKTKTGEEADRLFALAGEKYQAALEIKPDKHDALNNWGVALFDQAKTKTGEEADGLFTRAFERLSEAEALRPGSGAYNLACLSALRADGASSRRWLEKGLELGTLPSRGHLMKDADLDSVRGAGWFTKLLKKA